ncbi:transcriptional regulator [Phocicoccus schoeneichii]|uniref:Transcriptional regulatory protein n=1 Tax=Phocicoccus schoeneichii TaxID=1812261 RepID=A0A6V7R903_9BACL|nr:response regulator [Jeotgalicoccus schoeneichii]GGH53282.1 transcriptional regulator [Jeotgalicoccus schoeneichii]CAD2073841.1 Transcriptional regulatory protein CitT [Jeotgalicoccus schoeneichii]
MNILIVEDDFRIGEMYKEFLKAETEAKKIECVINAKEALEYLSANEVDIVIIDIYLPDMMGDTLAEEILKKYPFINFICISANQDAQIIKDLINLGVLHYLIKPVKLDTLGEIVNRFINMNNALSTEKELEQSEIDQYFTVKKTIENTDLPKGIDPVSLEKIRNAFEIKEEWVSSELGQTLGTSRTTVRRYLEYLREIGYLKVTQEFGDKGRPEKIYKK